MKVSELHPAIVMKNDICLVLYYLLFEVYISMMGGPRTVNVTLLTGATERGFLHAFGVQTKRGNGRGDWRKTKRTNFSAED